MKLVNSFIALFFAITSLNLVAQTNMGDPGFPQSSPADCNIFVVGADNFQDQGGASNYTSNYTGTITFCPDLTTGTKMSIVMENSGALTFDVDGSDSIYVYDGPDNTFPLLGVHNSVTDPSGFSHQASWNNPTGCLTVKFVTDGAIEGTGWLANVYCGNPQQPFEPHIEAYINGVGANALNPADSGFVDVCYGDSIMFIAKPVFPNSLETTGYGYSQDVDANIDFNWVITDGGTYPNNDTIWVTPPASFGYIVDLGIVDQYPLEEALRCKIRVSRVPNFAGTGPSVDVICLGDSAELLGGVTAADTVGVSIPPGSFNTGGSFAGLTYLPDGSGQEYTTPIQISGFPSGAVINDAQDLNQVCVTMEHSYLGDLEIWLECPNGTIVPLVNSYTGGFIPGGTSGGSTFLGHPYDDIGGGGAGIGWDYCFSSVFNTINGSITQNLGNTVPVNASAGPPQLSSGTSMDPSYVYQPETTFAGFSGCPVNGEWTIHVRDNIGSDDGWIFEWGLYFDPSYFPGLEGYQNYIVSDYWDNDPSIISGMNDTLILVQPASPGIYNYTFNVVDNFGCPYDTTVTLTVSPGPMIFSDTLICIPTLNVSGTQSAGGGVWSSANPEISFSSTTADNPIITASSPGDYSVSYTDNACNLTLNAQIIYPPNPVIFDDTAFCNLTYQVNGTQAYSTGGAWSSTNTGVTFSPSNTSLNPLITPPGSGNYVVTFTDNACSHSVSATITQIPLPSIFNDTMVCEYNFQVEGTQAYNNEGLWETTSPEISFVNPSDTSIQDPTLMNPLIIPSSLGQTYEVSFTDVACNQTVSASLYFPYKTYTQVLDTAICFGSSYTIFAQENETVNSFSWSTGETGPSITISDPGEYIVTAEGICGIYKDTAIVTGKVCDISAPNVIVLSSKAGNEAFFVQSDGVKEFQCSIINRWGNLIYEYSDVNGKWDGSSNGNIVDEGTYFYLIQATYDSGEKVQKQGFVEVKH